MREPVLLVIDMLRDFLDEDGHLFCGPDARDIIPFVAGKIREFAESGHPVILVNDAHEPDDLEFRRFPPHCVVGTTGADIVEALDVPGSRGYHLIEKRRFSAFHGTTLDDTLNRLSPSEVHVVGVCTNICVLYTVEELANRDYKVVVYRSGVASFDAGAHAWALQQMETVLGATVL